MMTREQREQAYAAIGILKNRGWTEHADAVSQALADLHDYEVSPSPLEPPMARWHVPGMEDSADTVGPECAPSAEETYVYRVVYQERLGSGPPVMRAMRCERSTPLLTCEDIEFLSQDIANQTDRSVVVVSWILMINEEGR